MQCLIVINVTNPKSLHIKTSIDALTDSMTKTIETHEITFALLSVRNIFFRFDITHIDVYVILDIE